MHLPRLLAALFLAVLPIAEAAERPNIIFILADDLGYGDLGCFGQLRIKTPHLDLLAREGVRFTQAYAGSTVCAPSRACLMTGRHTGHGHIRGNRELRAPQDGEFFGQIPLPEGTPTVARVLQQAGYATALCGKWGLGAQDTTGHPLRQGFDHSFGYLCQRHAHTYYTDHLWRGTERVPLDGKTWSHDLIAADALEWIRQPREKPFFLYLAFTTPHARLEVPDLTPYAGEAWPESEKRFAAMITRMDHDIGRVMAALKEKGLDEKTLVMFASDNGAMDSNSQKGYGGPHTPGFFNSSGPLRGAKRDLYEGGIRTPAIARWPGRIAPAQVKDTPWAFWDILPTVAELAGAPVPIEINGISIVPTLLRNEALPERPFYWEFHERGFGQAVRKGSWKAVRLGTGGRTELYDLLADIAEARDVADKHPDAVTELEGLFTSLRAPTDLWVPRDKPRTVR